MRSRPQIMTDHNSSYPPIAIVIPVFNRKDLVSDAIHSALAQTYPKVEVIVVDDGSKDGTSEELQSFGSRIRLLRQPHRGQSAARNLGWRSSEAHYILFLDSDDILEPYAIECLWKGFRAAEQKDSNWGVSYGEMLTCDSNLNPVKTKPKFYPSGDVLESLLYENFVRTGTYLVRKSILHEVGGFKEDLDVKEDRLLLFLISAHYKFVFVGREVVKYRRHAGPRARKRADKILAQGTKHLDYFFSAVAPARPEITRHKNKLYGLEHISLAKVAWKSALWEEYLYHWKKAHSCRPMLLLNPKFLMRAFLSSIYKLKKQE